MDDDSSISQDSRTVQTGLPRGRVTLMFTDVQGSTAAWERHGAVFGEALRTHEQLVRQSILRHNGHVVKTAGDGFMAVFSSAADAVRCGGNIQAELAAAPLDGAWAAVEGIRIRIGLHTGEPSFRDNDYFGPPVNRAARIADAAHGGMILLSDSTYAEAKQALPDGVVIKDHRGHRLKDLGDPVHLYELRGLDFKSFWSDRPLRTLESLRHNFPIQTTTLVGRTRERDELNALLSYSANRLITLSGPGGSGKTRLAIQIAADRLQDYPDGVWLVDLSTVRDPGAVPAAVALALRVEIPAAGDARAALISHLAARRVLMVVDNFEQVADAAVFVGEMLRECAGLTCLVTSREILHLSGERDYPVEPLSAPSAGDTAKEWTSYESVQLFLDRCLAVRPDFEISDNTGPVIGEICRRLDGIPLAIELAAARVRVISPPQILQRLTQRFDLLTSRLRDIPERQQTLRSTIDWSYDLLTETERQLFCELAVFTGGFFLEAAEAVCHSPDAFDVVFSLRDKSLLKTTEVNGDTRYYMLETIREYSSQKLLASDSLSSLRDRHAAYFLARAAEWSEKMATSGHGSNDGLQSMRADLDNIRAGMDWSASSDRPRSTMEFGKALFPYLRRHGMVDECEIRLIIAEDAARQVQDDRALARLLNQRGLLSMERAELPLAKDLFEESQALSQRLEDHIRVLVTAINLGNVYWMLGEFGSARGQWEGALTLTESAAQPRYEAFLRENLGILACQENRLAEADAYYAVSLAMHGAAGNLEGVASTLYNSSEVSRKREDFPQALSRLYESHAIYSKLDHQRGLSLAAVRIGLVLVEKGSAAEARASLDEGMRIARATSNRHAEMYGLTALGCLEILERNVEAARVSFAEAYRLSVELSDRMHRAETLLYASAMMDDDAVSLLYWLRDEYRLMGVEVPSRLLDRLSKIAPDSHPEFSTDPDSPKSTPRLEILISLFGR